MDKSETPLQFAVRFAQVDIDTLREGDFLNLRDELHRHFFKPTGALGPFTGGCWAIPNQNIDELGRADVTRLQREALRFLSAWAGQATFLNDFLSRSKSEDPHIDPPPYEGKFPDRYEMLQGTKGFTGIAFYGELDDVFGYMLTLMLQGGGGESLRLCECGKLFSKRGRRKFCSPRCLDRATKRRYRDKLKRVVSNGTKKK